MLKRKQISNGIWINKIQAAQKKTKNHAVLRNEVEEFDAIIQNAQKTLDIPVEPVVSCVTRHRMPAAKTQTQQVAAPLVGEERPLALGEGRLSLSLSAK